MLASSLPILGFGFLEAWRWRDASTRIAKERVLTKSEALTNEVRRLFEIRLSAFEVLAEQIRLQSGTHQLKPSQLSALMKFYAEKFGFVSVGLSDMNGKMLEYYHPDPVARAKIFKVNVLSHGYIDLILMYKTAVVTPLRKGKASARNLFFLSAPVWNYKKDEIIATVGSGVAPAEIQKIADRIMLPSPTLNYRVVDQDGVVVAGSGMDNHSDPITPTRVDLYSPVLGSEPEIRQGRDEKGSPMFASAQTLNLRTAKWTVIVSQSQDFLLQDERIAWRQMLMIMTGAIIASFVLATLISFLIAEPIERLIEGMQMIKKGHYEKWRQMSKQEVRGFKEIHAAWHALIAMAKRLHEYTVNLEGLVTERTRELDAQRVRAVESARLASLGEMAGGIAHEINNPLSIIYLVAEQQQSLFQQGKAEPVRTQEAFRNIGDTTQRIVKIINGLRTFSRDGENDPIEKAEIKILLEDTLTFCQQKFKHHSIDLRISYGPPGLMVYCRPVQFSQVILNLLNNAFDAVETVEEKWIQIGVSEGTESIEIRVSDSGAGVAEKYREKIFQPFFTLKEVGKGTGLGLSISRSIIESQGGRIELDIHAPHTSFVIRLPKNPA